MEFRIQISLLSLLVALLLFLQSQESGAIKCYECNSIQDKGCADPFNSSSIPLEECSYNDFETTEERNGRVVDHQSFEFNLCRKIRFQVRGEWRYKRTCATLGAPDKIEGGQAKCFSRTSPNGIFMEICTCNDRDGCNSN